MEDGGVGLEEGWYGHPNCITCGIPVDPSDKYEFLELSKIKYMYRKLFGGRYYELRCQSCVRDKKISSVLK